MINPEIHYLLGRSEQRRRDVELECRRAYRPDPLLDPAVVGSEAGQAPAREASAGFDLGLAS